MNENRRKFMRINSADAHCVVKLGIGESDGVVINESIEGLRIGNLELLILVADQRVTVVYDQETIVGRCRSVSRDPNGMFQIGVYRESDAYQPETTTILLNSFMRFEGREIVCVPLAVVDDKRLRIRLMDGNEFTVDRDQVFQITRDEREQQLRNDKLLQGLIQVYSLMDSQRQWFGREDVLFHEFGPPLKAWATAQ